MLILLALKFAIGAYKSPSFPWKTLLSISGTLLLLIEPTELPAVQRVVTVDDRAVSVSVSKTQLTVLVFPATVTQAATSHPALEIKTNDRHVILSPLDQPTDLVVTTQRYVYVVQLTPTEQAADTIIIEDARVIETMRQNTHPSASNRHAHDHAGLVVDLLEAAASNRWPRGTTVREEPPTQAPAWHDLRPLSVRSASVRQGPHEYQILVYRFRNDNGSMRSFREQEFYTGSEFGIALSRRTVEPGEDLSVFLVRPAHSINYEQSSNR